MKTDLHFPIKSIVLNISKRIVGGNAEGTSRNAAMDLQTHGPWDKNLVSRKVTNITVVLISEYSISNSDITAVSNALYFSYGQYDMIKLFQLTDYQVINNGYKIDHNPAKYKISIIDIISKIKRDIILTSNYNDKFIAVVIGNEKRGQADTPIYYLTHKLFLQEGILCQYISTSNINSYRGNISNFTSRNLQLQLYVKCGGIPWVIKNESIKNLSFTLGLGFSKIGKDSGYGVASVSVFDKNNYYTNIYSAKSFERSTGYSSGIYIPKEVIFDLVSENKIKSLLEDDESLRLVVHKGARYSNDEIEAFLESIYQYAGEILFVEILRTNYKFFNYSQGRHKMIYSPIPQMTGFIDNSGRGFLISTSENDGIGTPIVLEINIRSESTFNVSMVQVLNQIQEFISTSWNELFKFNKLLPATLDYSNRVAVHYTHDIIPHDNIRDQCWFI